MIDAKQIANALSRAGIAQLPPVARAHLANRLTASLASGDLTGFNLAGLRATTYGCARGGAALAEFPDIDAGARAAVANAYRAAPRDWSFVDGAALARLGGYPIRHASPEKVPVPTSGGAIRYVAFGDAEESGATRNADGSWDLTSVRVEGKSLGEFKWSYLIPGYGPYALVRDYFRPSEEAEATFRGLVADWEGYERIGVGASVLAGETDPATGLKRPSFRDSLVDWRTFRDEWKAGTIPGNETGGRLNAQVAISNMIRKNLAEYKIIDPALADSRHDRAGVDIEKSSEAMKDAAEKEQWCKGVPLCNWMTKPGQKIVMGPFGPMPENIMWAGGIGLGLLGLIAASGAIAAVRG